MIGRKGGTGQVEDALAAGFLDFSKMLGSGVYALCYNQEVVYIGKAVRLVSRIYTHKNLWERKRKTGKSITIYGVKAIRFNAVLIYPCPIAELDKVERAMIARFSPKDNTNLIPVKKVSLAEMGITLDLPGLRLVAIPPVEAFNRRV